MARADRYTVSGPGHVERGAADVRHGISVAQAWACEHLGIKRDNVLEFYVTAVGGDPQAKVTVNEDGAVETVLL